MTATGADRALAQAPLPDASLPPAVAKLLAAGGPAKALAAKGIAPLKPAEFLVALYQLAFDADPAVRAAAEAAPASLPDKVVAGPLGEALPPDVLHFVAVRLPATRTLPLEKILYNRGAADETFVALAGRLEERELEIVAGNEDRILRCPAILEALYGNRHARMSSVNRLVELCARNGVRVDGIPGFDEVARSIAADGGAATAAADAAFSAALSTASGGTVEVPDASDDELVADADADDDDEVELTADAEVVEDELGAEAEIEETRPPAPAARATKPPGGPLLDFSRLKLHEKIRLATLGNEYCRAHLVRDPNRVVALAAIRSPKVTDAEIVRTAANRQVCEEVIRYIAGQRDLVKNYAVRMSLVNNPKTPLALSLRFLSSLNAEDVKAVSRSKNVPTALSTAARRLVATRGSRAR